MICPHCARAADAFTRTAEQHPDLGPNQHPARICRDAAFQQHGCACEHGQRGATQGNEGEQ